MSARLACPALVAALLAAAAPGPARAWGGQGHVIAAAIAEERLTPRARRLVAEVLGEVRLSDEGVATWADAQRDRATRPWHYADIPFGARAGYDRSRDCARGCAVEAIERAARVLRTSRSPLERADALRWLVHLVADLHQPLHAGDPRDRGGNDLRVRVGRARQPTNLHAVWDHDVVKPLLARGGPLPAARALAAAIAPGDAAAWAAETSPARWAEASNAEAKAIYAGLGRTPGDPGILALPHGYREAERDRAAAALQRAGVRLAALLDRIAAERDGAVR